MLLPQSAPTKSLFMLEWGVERSPPITKGSNVRAHGRWLPLGSVSTAPGTSGRERFCPVLHRKPGGPVWGKAGGVQGHPSTLSVGTTMLEYGSPGSAPREGGTNLHQQTDRGAHVRASTGSCPRPCTPQYGRDGSHRSLSMCSDETSEEHRSDSRPKKSSLLPNRVLLVPRLLFLSPLKGSLSNEPQTGISHLRWAFQAAEFFLLET